MIYTGIGSRVITIEGFRLVRSVAKVLAESGWTVRSGGAAGADTGFLLGAFSGCGVVHNYLPWVGFRGFQMGFHPWGGENKSGIIGMIPTCSQSLESVDRFHPNPGSLYGPGRSLMRRSYCQIFGCDETASSFVLCWAPEDGYGVKGGTGQVVRIARFHRIPVINLWLNSVADRLSGLDSCSNPYLTLMSVIGVAPEKLPK